MQFKDDRELLSLFHNASTKEEGFTSIVKKYQEKLYWHIRRMVITHDDADDVLQNTFIKVWKGLENFREDSQLYTWLYRIATNESLTHIEQQKKESLYRLEMWKMVWRINLKLNRTLMPINWNGNYSLAFSNCRKSNAWFLT